MIQYLVFEKSTITSILWTLSNTLEVITKRKILNRLSSLLSVLPKYSGRTYYLYVRNENH